jgi:transcriptional regulator with XRE-family HTH domain
MDELIQKLEIYRLERKISQRQLAEQLDVAYNTVNRWFRRKYKPSKIQEYQIRKLIKDIHYKM